MAKRQPRESVEAATEPGLASTTVSTRVTEELRERLKAKVEAAGMDTATYLRRLVLQDLKHSGEDWPVPGDSASARDLEQVRNSIDLLRADLARLGRHHQTLRDDTVTALRLVLGLLPGIDPRHLDAELAKAFPPAD